MINDLFRDTVGALTIVLEMYKQGWEINDPIMIPQMYDLRQAAGRELEAAAKEIDGIYSVYGCDGEQYLFSEGHYTALYEWDSAVHRYLGNAFIYNEYTAAALFNPSNDRSVDISQISACINALSDLRRIIRESDSLAILDAEMPRIHSDICTINAFVNKYHERGGLHA